MLSSGCSGLVTAASSLVAIGPGWPRCSQHDEITAVDRALGRVMSVADELLGNNDVYAGSFHDGSVPMRPAKHTAVIACMDARLDPVQVLGLAVGDAHVLRNAGGVVTDDMIRSLVLSQRLQGTDEI